MAFTKPWSEADDAFLIDHHGKLSNREIGNRLGRAVYGVDGRVSRMRKLGLIPPAKLEPEWTEYEDRQLIAGYAHFTTEMLAEDLGRTKDAIDSRLRRLRKAGWDINAVPRGRTRTTQALSARASHRPEQELSLSAEREALRDEVMAHLLAEIRAKRMDELAAQAIASNIKSRVLLAPQNRLKRFLAMPIERVVREAA